MERGHVFGDRWKEMDQTYLHAYFGVLILAGVIRSNGESTESLWDAETGREPFSATMSLENFFPGLSASIAETPDQLSGRETS